MQSRPEENVRHRLDARTKHGMELALTTGDSCDAACPRCLLLWLATDEDSVRLVDELERDFTVGPETDGRAEGLAEVRTIDGKVAFQSLVRDPHPCCDGPHRACPRVVPPSHVSLGLLEAADRLAERWEQPWTGVIRDLAEAREWFPPELVDRLGDRFVFLAYFANPVFPRYPRIPFHDNALGTARDQPMARAKALMETAERYCALTPAPSDGQAAALDSPLLDVRAAGFGALADANATPVRTLEGQQWAVPTSLLFCNPAPGQPDCNVTTSGCAAHTDPTRADVGAALELLERDATLHHWLLGVRRPHVDPDTWPASVVHTAQELHRYGHDLHLVDVSELSGLPTYIAVIANYRDEWPDTIVGSACHVSAPVALEKAVDEAFATTVVAWASQRSNERLEPVDVFEPVDHSMFYRVSGRRDLLDHYHEADGTTALPDPPAPMTADEMMSLVDGAARARGHTLVYADLTLPGVRSCGITVRRAFCPTMLVMAFGTGNLRVPTALDGLVDHHRLGLPHPYG